MATICITDLQLRAVIGIFDWERKAKQDVLINVEFDYDATQAIATDTIEASVDYKEITKKIIEHVETSDYMLLEKLTDRVLKIVMENPRVTRAAVRIDKPGAIRFAKSVSVELNAKR